jgi:putative aldouronate transport system permease protein
MGDKGESNAGMPLLKHPAVKKMVRQRFLYFLLIPGVVWAALFSYAPMVGLYMGFTDYKPVLGDFWGSLFTSKFVGFQWFEFFFSGRDFGQVMRNTLVSSVLTLAIGFFIPIVIAITLNEVRIHWFKRVVQTTSYFPFFISWVVAASIVMTLLSAEGPVNQLLMNVGIVEQGVLFLQEGKLFWIIIALSNAWKDMGYNSIMYLAAIAAVPPSLFEAAKMDGAGRMKQIWHVLLPLIRPTIIILLILNIGNLMNTGFDQYFLLGNSLNRSYSDVVDTYAFRYGIQNGMFSYASAVSLFKSVIAFILVVSVNGISKKMGQTHLF